jgi:hypothetical protein
LVKIRRVDKKMLTYDHIIKCDESRIGSLLNQVDTNEFINAIINEFPDYYENRGRNLNNLPEWERQNVIEVLKKELK